MAGRIKGISVTLYQKTQRIVDEEPVFDAAGEPVYVWTPALVENVLVAPVSGNENIDSERLKGRTAVYTLGIPKGDTHEWEGCRVRFWGEDYEVIGKPTQGIEGMIPLQWNKKVTVARYE